jgi:RHS repeat-associated protein
MTDTAGAARARYELDPYGRRTKVAGDLDSDLGYTSMGNHSATSLSLAAFRTYDPERGRWLSEDPAGLVGGVNLNAYVENDPINKVDPLGLWSQWQQMAAPLLPGLWLWHPNVIQSAPVGWIANQTTADLSAGFGDNLTSIPFTSISLTGSINNSLGNPVNKCSTAYATGGWAAFAWGIAFGAAGGAKALPGGLKNLSNAFKGSIGESLSLVEHLLHGRWPTAFRKATIPGFRTQVDITFRNLLGGLYYLEAKFGKSTLTKAQRLAAQSVAAYHVDRWTYPFFGRIGAYLGAGTGAIVANPNCDP